MQLIPGVQLYSKTLQDIFITNIVKLIHWRNKRFWLNSINFITNIVKLIQADILKRYQAYEIFITNMVKLILLL